MIHRQMAHMRGMQLALVASAALSLPTIARSQSVMRAGPEGTVVRGQLRYRVSAGNGTTEGAIGDGHVFVLSTDRQQILGHARTLSGGNTTGLWEVSGLPDSGEVVVVAFSDSVHRLIWMDKVALGDRKYIDLGPGYASLPGFRPGGPPAGRDLAALSPLLGLLNTLGWVAGEINSGLSAKQTDELTDRLLSTLNPPPASPVPSRASTLRLPLRDGPNSNAIDLIFCIDTTGSMKDDIDAVKQSASRLIDQLVAVSSSVRVALVAYRDYGSEYVTRGYRFTTNKEEIRSYIMGLTVGEGGDPPEAVYEALLAAIHTEGLGAWRAGVKKIILLMGDAPPHNKRHTLSEVVTAAKEVDPAHVFPIAVAGADRDTMAAFGEIALQTGGEMGSTTTATDLPREILKMTELGSRVADVAALSGRVERRMGDAVRIVLDSPGRVLPGMTVLVFSAETAGLVIAEGPITVGEELTWQVEIRAAYGTERIRSGCPVQIVNE